MTKIEGLSAELRKAVKCMQTHYPADKKAHSGDCVYWLPAVLAGKEMCNHDENSLREIKELVQRKLKNDNDARDGFVKKYSLTDTEFFGIVEAVLGKG